MSQDRDIIFALACRDNREALAFLHLLFKAADAADNIHDDGDVEVASLVVDLVALPFNPFYKRHEAALHSLIVTAVLCWDVSNGMEKGPDREHYSCQLEQVLFYVAMLCGGYQHGKAVVEAWNS